jgi:hypothetical protein
MRQWDTRRCDDAGVPFRGMLSEGAERQHSRASFQFVIGAAAPCSCAHRLPRVPRRSASNKVVMHASEMES